MALSIVFCVLLLLVALVGGSTETLNDWHNANGLNGVKRSFVVDFNDAVFRKDRHPFKYVSGSILYSRILPGSWRDRLRKMAAAGLDAAQVYVPWNFHEPSPGVFEFGGAHDLEEFIQIAQEEGLLVILRAGPYICAEWDFGGLPAWLLQKNGSVVVRTMDPGYIVPVDKWLSVLLPKVRKLLYSNGGPVIMVQVENEYGSYFACDHSYMDHLAKTFRKYLGDDIVLFTTDGDDAKFLKCGAHANLFTTIDFGPGANMSESFDVIRKYQPNGPLVNSEFYTGWLDYWGGGHAHGDTKSIVNSLKQIIQLNASVNMYMFEGGTNFGYTNEQDNDKTNVEPVHFYDAFHISRCQTSVKGIIGADPTFSICPTSYDYDAPLSESGDTTNKFMAIRKLLSQYKNISIAVPANSTKKAYGKLLMSWVGHVLDLMDKVGPAQPAAATYPKTMEQLGQSGGFIVYRTELTKSYPGSVLNVSGIRDRAHVFLDKEFKGIVDRQVQVTLMLIGVAGQTLDLIVENQGHINFGTQINNGSKGLLWNVTLGSDILTNWKIFPLNFTRLFDQQDTTLKFKSGKLAKVASSTSSTPAVYSALFTLPPQTPKADTFLRMDGWFKGQAFLNSFNLGRYWPIRGPQVTLYIPAALLRPFPEINQLTMVELDHAPCGTKDNAGLGVQYLLGSSASLGNCSVTFVDKPELNGRA